MTYRLIRQDNQAQIELPMDMRWVDEFDWNAVAQTTPEYTLTGSMIVQQGVKKAGRPITLAGDWAWLNLGIIRTLRDWCDVPELVLTLHHPDGRQFNVMFRLHEKGLSNVSPISFSVPEQDSERYTAEIALMTV